MKIECETYELINLVSEVQARAGQSAPTASSDSRAADYSPPKLARLSQAFGSATKGNKIEAIKIVREIYGMGLKEAKDIVEGNYF